MDDSEKKVPEKIVHTYHDDIERAMAEGEGGTMASVLEEDRMQKKEKINKSFFSKKNLLFLGIGFILLILSLGILWYVLEPMKNKNVVVEKTTLAPSLVRTDTEASLTLDESSPFKLQTLVREIVESDSGDLEMRHIYFTEQRAGNLIRTNRSETFEALNLTLPQTLLQGLSEDFMFGTYKTENGTHPFFVFRVSSFDRAFVGMGEWETVLLDTLKNIFALDETLLSPESFLVPFESELVRNKNVRVLRLDGENPTLLYTFLNEQTLVLTTSPEVVTEITARIGDRQIFQ